MLKAKAHSRLLCQAVWRAPFDSLPYPAAITNGRHRFLYVNPAFERFYGWKLADIVGLAPWVLTPLNQDLEPIKRLRKALAGRLSSWSGNLTNVDAKGKLVRVHLVAFAIHGERGGAPVAYLSLVAPESEGPNLLPCLAQNLGAHWLRHAATTLAEPAAVTTARGERQEEILRLTRMGYSTKEVALFMGIATSTVANVKWKFKRRVQTRRTR